MIDEVVIDNLNVSESWKTRFKIINKYCCDDKVFLQFNKEYQQSGSMEILCSIYFKNGGIWTILAAGFFGPFYYLLKGMWLKAIIYTLALCVLLYIISIFINLSYGASFAGAWAILAPYDYFRLKVYKKQW